VRGTFCELLEPLTRDDAGSRSTTRIETLCFQTIFAIATTAACGVLADQVHRDPASFPFRPWSSVPANVPPPPLRRRCRTLGTTRDRRARPDPPGFEDPTLLATTTSTSLLQVPTASCFTTSSSTARWKPTCLATGFTRAVYPPAIPALRVGTYKIAPQRLPTNDHNLRRPSRDVVLTSSSTCLRLRGSGPGRGKTTLRSASTTCFDATTLRWSTRAAANVLRRRKKGNHLRLRRRMLPPAVPAF